MKDPLRIPRVLETLSQAWERQPDLTLPQLYGVLESRGIGWNSSDEEVSDVLDALVAERPSRLTAEAPGRYLVETENPHHRITLDPWWAAVRPARAGRTGRAQDATALDGSARDARDAPQPTVWRHGGIRRCATGQPLSVLDADGTVHRFGLVTRISVLSPAVSSPTDAPNLDGLTHDRLDGHVYLLRLAGDEFAGTTVLVDRSLWIFDVSRREVHRDKVRWSRLVSATVGAELVVERVGGELLRLPAVEQVTVLE
ncbi:hypothetical protein ACT3SZ_04465 [Corynebacterium sp. AOP40-9SA-29]|uniref:hypothetical protein n=1 Tax=Corynebacterium sp. AOP40-9SA-29 TaxID=3457677 RepID=UPI00403415C6